MIRSCVFAYRQLRHCAISHCHIQNIKAVCPVVSEKKIFEFFSHSKSMETINLRDLAKFDPRGMNGTIYVEDHSPLLHTKYQSCGPSGFREEVFFSFSYCRSMETIDPRCMAKFDPGDMIGTIYVEDH